MHAVAERAQLLKLVQSLSDEQVNYVLTIVRSLPSTVPSHPKCALRGKFSSYASPVLRAKEKEAWGLAAEEKHGLR